MFCGVFSQVELGEKNTLQLFVCQITITVLIIFLKTKNWGKKQGLQQQKKHKPQSKTMRGKMSKQTYHECFPS